MTTAKRERRAGPRLELETAVEVREGADWMAGTTSDLSEGGMRLRTDIQAEAGTVLQVEFMLPTGAFAARAIVRHVADGQLALEFFGLSHQAQMTLTATMGQGCVSWG